MPQLDPALVRTIAALTGAGFSLLLLGGDADGKAPLRSVKDVRLNLSQVHGPMSRRGSSMYCVRLDDLAVLDLDKDDPALVEALEARFGPAAVHVQTARGRHLWYCAPDGPLPNLRGEGLPVDVKFGLKAYVAESGSVRPDRQRYAR